MNVMGTEDVSNPNVCSKVLSKEGLNLFYTNADQFVNKRDDLLMFIANDQPDIMLITEVIPKKNRKIQLRKL